MRTVSNRPYWDSWLASAGHYGPFAVDPTVRWTARTEAFEQDHSFVDRLVGSLTATHLGAQLNVDYLALLDRVLLDRVVSVSKASALEALAQGLGLTPEDVRLAHRAYFDGLVATAWEDHVLTDAEAAEIRSVSELLSIDEDVVASSLAAAPSTPAPLLTGGFRLEPGDIVVLTGEMSKPREAWSEVLTRLGLIVKSNVVKKTKLLVAADPDSLSGKAKTAREYGVTIVNEAGLEKLLDA